MYRVPVVKQSRHDADQSQTSEAVTLLMFTQEVPSSDVRHSVLVGAEVLHGFSVHPGETDG
jgi:hypothetical protein